MFISVECVRGWTCKTFNPDNVPKYLIIRIFGTKVWAISGQVAIFLLGGAGNSDRVS